MDLNEIILWILGIAFAFILGWLTNYYFYWKQRKEGEANTAILKSLQDKADAEIRLGNDNRGKIIKNSNGTYGIAWKQEIVETLSLTDSNASKKENKQ